MKDRMSQSSFGPLFRTMAVTLETAMPAKAYLSLTSLSGTRPHAVPDDVRGFRREDPAGRCGTCRHHARIEGPAPATRYTGEPGVADVCLAHRRDLLIARPTTPPCAWFEAAIL